MFFKNGFYENEVDGSVEIDQETYLALLSGQSEGKQIVANDKGFPILIDPQPSAFHILKNGKWEIDPKHQEKIKAQHQNEIWEQIKQKRHTITRGGVYVKSVKKWFHTDDSSRTQYLALQILPSLPADLAWKTMDNSFVKMDKTLLTELAMTILQAEQADFANAERHRAKMLQADNPLEYDYSTGWTAIYEQGATDE